jgi:hypothetical protein
VGRLQVFKFQPWLLNPGGCCHYCCLGAGLCEYFRNLISAITCVTDQEECNGEAKVMYTEGTALKMSWFFLSPKPATLVSEMTNGVTQCQQNHKGEGENLIRQWDLRGAKLTGPKSREK